MQQKKWIKSGQPSRNDWSSLDLPFQVCACWVRKNPVENFFGICGRICGYYFPWIPPCVISLSGSMHPHQTHSFARQESKHWGGVSLHTEKQVERHRPQNDLVGVGGQNEAPCVNLEKRRTKTWTVRLSWSSHHIWTSQAQFILAHFHTKIGYHTYHGIWYSLRFQVLGMLPHRHRHVANVAIAAVYNPIICAKQQALGLQVCELGRAF